MQLLLRWIASAVALIITVYIGQYLHIKLGFKASGPLGVTETAFIAALIIGLVNAVIRPIVKLVAMPITCLTLGLFSLVINALLFWLTALIVHGFYVGNFVAALFGSIVMSLIGAPLNWALASTVEKSRDKT